MTNSNISCCNRPFNDRPEPPTNGLVTNLTPTSALISWTPGIGGTPVAFYRLWQATEPAHWAAIVDGNTPWLSLENLIPDSIKFYIVYAIGVNKLQSYGGVNIYFHTPPLYNTQPYYPPRPGYCPPSQNYYPPQPNCGPYKNSGW